MRARHLIAAFLGSLLIAGQAPAQSRLSFDTIFDLPFVDSLEFSPDGGMLFVATEGKLLHWQVQPLELLHSQAIDILPNQMSFGPDGQLYSVGLALQQNPLSRSVSKAVSLTSDGDGAGQTFEISDSNSNLGISQYSTIAFASTGSPIVASTSSFTANPFPTQGDSVDGEIYPQLKFTCGGASQMSIFDIDGVDYYLTSTSGTAGLEFGKLTLGEGTEGDGDCFAITRPRKGEKSAPSYDALRHKVIDIENTAFADRGSKSGVIVLDPNTNSLHLFRIEPYGDSHFLSRVGALEISLTDYMPVTDRAVVMTDLSTDHKGREIHVASNAANVVLRFEFNGSGLRSRGRFAMSGPVRGLKMSPEGATAAIVTGSEPFGGDWRIVLIANPASLSDWLQIPASFPSIRNLQELLNANGYPAGVADGILGPQTTSAIAAYRRDIAAAAQEGETRSVALAAVGSQSPEPAPAAPSHPSPVADLDAAIHSSFPGFLLKNQP